MKLSMWQNHGQLAVASLGNLIRAYLLWQVKGIGFDCASGKHLESTLALLPKLSVM